MASAGKGAPTKNAPGMVRDAIIGVLNEASDPLTVKEISERVVDKIGSTPTSSIRSYLRLNTPGVFVREGRGLYQVKRETKSPRQRRLDPSGPREPSFHFQEATLHHDDCFTWLERQPGESIHAVVTDPPYGLYEYTDEQQTKLTSRKGGVWRIPPSFDGNTRSPLPRFTMLNAEQLDAIAEFFTTWAELLKPVLTPGANVVVASNPLMSYIVSNSLAKAGLERRGEIIRLTMTMRG